MGRLHDASAMVHTGVRATKEWHASNFICSPIAILAVFFVAMRGAKGPTLNEMQAFIGVRQLPKLPPPPLHLLPTGSSDHDEDESDVPSRVKRWFTTWVRPWLPRISWATTDNDKKASDSSTQKEEEETGSTKALFSLATRIYVSPETAATKAFQDYADDVIIATHHRAEAQRLNFLEGERAEMAVNRFVATETDNHIQRLLTPGSITPETRLLAICAAFFKAGWKTVFDMHLTEQKTFYALKGSKPATTAPADKDKDGMAGAESATPRGKEPQRPKATKGSGAPSSGTSDISIHFEPQQVSTMSVKIEKPPFFVQQTEDYIAVGLPYEDTHYVLFVVMPVNTENLPVLTIPPEKRQKLGFEDTEFPYVEQIIEEMKTMATERVSVEIHVEMPKFHLKAAENRVDLKTVFKDKLGVGTPFTPGKANFAGIDGGLEDLYVNLFVHAADIEVDEKGTVASGAVTLSIATRGLKPRPGESFDLKFDKPFYFQLRYLTKEPKVVWTKEDSNTENAAEFGAASRATRGAIAAATPASVDDADDQDLVLFSGNIFDAAAAQS